MISDKLVEFARQGGQYRFGHPLNRIPRSAWPQQGELERARGRNMTDAERIQQSLQQRGITADPAPDYTEDGLMAIEGDTKVPTTGKFPEYLHYRVYDAKVPGGGE